MKAFRWYQPTDIRFGPGRLAEVGPLTAAHGRRALLVTGSGASSRGPVYERVRQLLGEAGLEVAHFDGVTPNPTIATVSAGADRARGHEADVIVGVGGGSSIDTAKAIAVEATHDGTAWDYLFYKEPQPDARTLPVVAVSTTSGTGAHVTQVAVVTHSERRDKSALFNELLYPRAAIVDPELMRSVPAGVTAATGFDVFAHSFESYLHPNASPHTVRMALEAIRLVVENLPRVLEDGTDLESRSRMAWADTLAGLCIANAGVTLPHGIGMAIGGMYPHVPHGESLAVVYPAVARFTWEAAAAEYATLGRIFDPSLAGADDDVAAEAACDQLDEFMRRVGLWLNLERMEVPKQELPSLARQSLVLPDHSNHPRAATESDVMGILEESYGRS